MEKITRDNFVQSLQRAGYIISKCAACGIPKWKVWKTGFNNLVVEIRPTQAQYGTFVIFKDNSAVQSGYLYELDQVIDKYFQAAASA